MAFTDTYRESIQSKHLANVGFSSTAKGATNEAYAVKNPHQILAAQVPVTDVVGTYGPLTASGIASGFVEEHTVKLTADPTVNGNKAWLAYETDCTSAGHSARGAIRLDQLMRYANTQYKIRVFADNGSGTAPDLTKEVLPSETQFNWEYDASAGIIYFDADPTTFGFTGPLWATMYTYTGEFLADKIDATVSGGGKTFLSFTDGVETAIADSSQDEFRFNAEGNINVSMDGLGKTLTISGGAVSESQEGHMLMNGSSWELNSGFTSVPSDLIVYYNGVKNKGGDAEYYTTTVTSGILSVDFGFDTYVDDWVNVEWGNKYDVAYGVKAWVVRTSAYTALPGDRIIVDTTTTPTYTINLPSSPSQGTTVSFFDGGGNCTNVSVILGRNGNNIMSLAQDLSIDTANASFDLVYYNASQGWRIVE